MKRGFGFLTGEAFVCGFGGLRWNGWEVGFLLGSGYGISCWLV